MTLEEIKKILLKDFKFVAYLGELDGVQIWRPWEYVHEFPDPNNPENKITCLGLPDGCEDPGLIELVPEELPVFAYIPGTLTDIIKDRFDRLEKKYPSFYDDADDKIYKRRISSFNDFLEETGESFIVPCVEDEEEEENDAEQE